MKHGEQHDSNWLQYDPEDTLMLKPQKRFEIKGKFRSEWDPGGIRCFDRRRRLGVPAPAITPSRVRSLTNQKIEKDEAVGPIRQKEEQAMKNENSWTAGGGFWLSAPATASKRLMLSYRQRGSTFFIKMLFKHLQ